MKIRTNIHLTLSSLIAIFFFFEWSSVDILVQDLFYNSSSHQWLLSRQEYFWTGVVFYSGVKIFIIIFGLGILALYLLSFKLSKTPLYFYRKDLLVVFLSLIIVPTVVGILKTTSDVPCPCDTLRYGGEYHYFQILDAKPTNILKHFRCFPAGHASGGFALMSLFFLFKTQKNRYRAFYVSLAIGWSMGLYKMLIGHHYLSHTIISMLLAWFIILILHTSLTRRSSSSFSN